MNSQDDDARSSEEVYWKTYLDAAAVEDRYLPDSWEANTGSVLTFTGLFAATVAAFIVESYRYLSPDSGDRTAELLAQLLAATANVSTNTPVNVAPLETFQVSTSSIIVNSLWFSSLVIALFCALLATLIQEWARDYKRDINRRRTLDDSSQIRAFNHIYIRMGIDRYGMQHAVSCVSALVHLSVILFATGLAIFLFPINHTVAYVTVGVLSVFALIYLVTGALPLFDSSCPYRTPITHILAAVYRSVSGLLPSKMPSSRARRAQVRAIVSRTVTDYNNFLSASRFIFAWDRISPQMVEGQFEDLLKGSKSALGRKVLLPGFVRSKIVGHLCADLNFVRRLRQHILMPRQDLFKAGFNPIIFRVIYLLSEQMFAYVEDSSEMHKWDLAAGIYLDILSGIAAIAQNHVFQDTKFAAHLCLHNVFCSLVKMCSNAHKRGLGLTLQDVRFAGHFPDAKSGVNFELLRLEEIHPSGLLLVMQYQSYNAITNPSDESLKHLNTYRKWMQHMEYSCFIPLHADKCCKSSKSIMLSQNGWAHMAASCLLTIVCQILEAPDAAAAIIKDTAIYPPETLPLYFQDALVRRLPSPQFIDALRTAGLTDWITSENDFSSGPITGVLRNFLRANYWGAWCVWSLRSLAKHVDWEAYRRTIQAIQPTAPLGYIGVLPGSVNTAHERHQRIPVSRTSHTDAAAPSASLGAGRDGGFDMALDASAARSNFPIDGEEHRDNPYARRLSAEHT